MKKEIKIYRASYRDSFYEHKGYEYFSNRKTALKEQNFNNKNRDLKTSSSFDEIEEINFTLNKKGVLDLLNNHCAYPDNG